MRDREYEVRSLGRENQPYLHNHRYCTVYAVTREYGGPEEGGWWYDWFTFVATFPVPRTFLKKRNIAKLSAFFQKIQEQYAEEIQYGDISSVLGGCELAVHMETYPRECQTKRSPHYE